MPTAHAEKIHNVVKLIRDGLRSRGVTTYRTPNSDPVIGMLLDNGKPSGIAVWVKSATEAIRGGYEVQISKFGSPTIVYADDNPESVAVKAVLHATALLRTCDVAETKENKINDDKHSHYKRDVSKLDYIDVYRIIDLYQLNDPCFQHALKKILVPGERGHKDLKKDIQDIIDTMQRKLEMMREDEK